MQWQPIETAPKDGTPILGFADGEQTTVQWLEIVEHKGYFTLIVCGPWAVDGEWWPTHWMPLPDPPDDSGVKESLTAQPDHIRDATKMVCRWWQDEHGNWCCSCRATLPQFTPWRSLSPAGHNCPYCRAIIGVEPRYDEQIHTCGPFCERPACVQRRTEDGEFRRTHDKP